VAVAEELGGKAAGKGGVFAGFGIGGANGIDVGSWASAAAARATCKKLNRNHFIVRIMPVIQKKESAPLLEDICQPAEILILCPWEDETMFYCLIRANRAGCLRRRRECTARSIIVRTVSQEL
jgi:hypothetical protein